ncbi:thioesterase family protein [Myxococcota bacterium]|nr:thioesterase family protein [Myxococcota bacterium]
MTCSKNTRFDHDTSVARVDEGRYRVDIDRGWWVERGPNGGYIAALLLRAICSHVEDSNRTPRSFTIHYVSPPAEGEAHIQVDTERRGRSLTSVSVRMMQGSYLRAMGLAALSTPRESQEFDHHPMPEVPPPSSIAPKPLVIPIHQRYEHRFVSDPTIENGAREARSVAWLRAAEPQPLDPFLIAAYADALPPSSFALTTDDFSLGPVPTVELTVHFRADPSSLEIAPDAFCLAVCRSRLARDGFVEEDGEIWSPCGTLLAQSRQLAVALGR